MSRTRLADAVLIVHMLHGVAQRRPRGHERLFAQFPRVMTIPNKRHGRTCGIEKFKDRTRVAKCIVCLKDKIRFPPTVEAKLAPPCDRGSNRFEHLWLQDRKSTRLNSSHQIISYAVFCSKKKIIAEPRFSPTLATGGMT